MHKRIFILLFLFILNTSMLLAQQPFMPDANMSRADVPEQYKWDLSDLVSSDAEWEKGIQECAQKLDGISQFHAGLNTAKGLFNYMDAYFKLDNRVNRLTLYAGLQRDVESTNQMAITRHEKALGLTEQLMREGAVYRRTILGMPEKKLQAFISEEKGLQQFGPYINSLRRRAERVLSPAEERILSLAGDNLWAQIDLNELPAAPEKAFRALVSEMTLPIITAPDGKQVRLSFSNYGRFRGSDNRQVRKETVAAMFGTLKGLENTFATTLGEQARFSLFLAKARGYDTVLEAYLDKDELTPDVYYNLVNTVRANVKPLHKYVELRKKLLKLDEVHLYDLYVPLVEAADIKMDYQNGTNIIVEALQPMGPDYIANLKTGLDPASGWIDIYPSNDKGSGAFSASTYGVHPYVKMNFQNSFDDVSTLAHEYGHALHSHYSMSGQSYLSWRYPPFLAEIASTCNEALLSQYMIKNAKTKQEKAWLLSELLETIRTTIYRQTLFAEFELRLHELAEAGEPVTAEKLNNIYEELIKTYYGPAYSIDENDHMEWAYIPHFYYKYYVFTYATGLSAGIAFAEKIQEEGQPARDAYLTMLKGGNSRPPLDMLRDAGVDMTKPQAIQSALQLFDRTVDELDKLLAEK